MKGRSHNVVGDHERALDNRHKQTNRHVNAEATHFTRQFLDSFCFCFNFSYKENNGWPQGIHSFCCYIKLKNWTPMDPQKWFFKPNLTVTWECIIHTLCTSQTTTPRWYLIHATPTAAPYRRAQVVIVDLQSHGCDNSDCQMKSAFESLSVRFFSRIMGLGDLKCDAGKMARFYMVTSCHNTQVTGW